MTKNISTQLLETLKPSIRNEIKNLLEKSFELAMLINDKGILEDTIDKLSDQYANKFSEVVSVVQDSQYTEDLDDVSETVPEKQPKQSLREKTGKGRNLVTGDKLLATFGKGMPALPTPNLRKQNKHGYTGVEKHRKRWRARYSNVHAPGSYASPEEAARVYDRIRFMKTGSIAGLNFPEEYKK